MIRVVRSMAIIDVMRGRSIRTGSSDLFLD